MIKLSLIFIVIASGILIGGLIIHAHYNSIIEKVENSMEIKYLFDTKKLSLKNLKDNTLEIRVEDKTAKIKISKMRPESIAMLLDQFFVNQSGVFTPKYTSICKYFFINATRSTINASNSNYILVESIECR